MLNFNLEFQERAIFLKISEEGSRRIVYRDDVKLNIPIPSGWDSSRKIEIKLDQIPLLAQTGRLFYLGKRLDFRPSVKLYWKGEKESLRLAAYFQDIGPIENCDLLIPQCFISGSILGFFSFPWKWLERFRKGPICLDGIEKKRFLEEEPLILWKEGEKVNVFPILILRNSVGSFADLWFAYRGMGEIAFCDPAPHVKGASRKKEEEIYWEKDLIEAGYQKGRDFQYYCSGEKTKQTIQFLMEMGWEVRDANKRRIEKERSSLEVREEGGRIAVRGLNREHESLLDGILEGDWVGETLYLKRHQAPLLVPYVDKGNWEESIRNIVMGFREIEHSPPSGSFRGTLFPYQQKGVDWLNHLYRFGFSGLLADEMGLGKTVQVLAFFSRLRTKLPILIVAPTSLLPNWRIEIGKFLGVEPYVHSGPYRLKNITADLILTSYAILRQDEELFSQMEFEVVALDEANAIKRAATQTAKAACGLKSKFRISITGTPVENREEELHSQFRFLIPELSPTKRNMRPFILRRRKEDVQIELPEKIEQIVWVEMGDDQRGVYEQFRKGIKPNSLKRMEILEAILRLRQICDDPRLVGEDTGGAKIEQLMIDLEEAAAEGRKVIVYSQFTGMLQQIAREIPWEFLYLDGSTPLAERERAVRCFQEEANPLIFLISLKAGGVGLNLTAAETVILLDPWWNNAVENQAIDRAHRIGQKKSVLAKRYLTPDSIEEKMLKIKEKKLELDFESTDLSWTEAELLELLD